MADVAAEALAERLREHPAATDGLVFTSREHKLLNRHHFNRYVWKPALVQAGLEPRRENGMRALRHDFASVLLDAGESVLADCLGHSDPGFTLRTYALDAEQRGPSPARCRRRTRGLACHRRVTRCSRGDVIAGR